MSELRFVIVSPEYLAISHREARAGLHLLYNSVRRIGVRVRRHVHVLFTSVKYCSSGLPISLID